MAVDNKNKLIDLNSVKVGDYIILAANSQYYFLKINGFILKDVRGDCKLQLSAVYPKSDFARNDFYNLETLDRLEAQIVKWTEAKKLIKLLYG